MAQSRKRSVDDPEISNLGDPFELFRFHLLDGRKNRGHRIVHPDVDRSDLLLDHGGCLFNGCGICNIRWKDERRSAEILNLTFCRLQSLDTARKQADFRPMPSKLS